MASGPEAKVKLKVKNFLNKQPSCWWYMPVSNGMGQMGIPDFVGCFMGIFFAIETKAPGKLGNTTALQQMQLAKIAGAGGFACVADDMAIVEAMFVRMKIKAAA